MLLLVRVVDVETSSLLRGAEAEAAWEYMAEPAPAPAALDLDRALSVELTVLGERRRNGQWEGVPVTDGTTLASGEQFQVHARPSADCALYLLLEDAQGRLVRLYPDPGRSGRVQGGHTFQVPRPGGSDWFVLDEHAGTETLYLAAWVPGSEPADLAQTLASVATWDDPSAGQAVAASLGSLDQLVADRPDNPAAGVRSRPDPSPASRPSRTAERRQHRERQPGLEGHGVVVAPIEQR